MQATRQSRRKPGWQSRGNTFDQHVNRFIFRVTFQSGDDISSLLAENIAYRGHLSNYSRIPHFGTRSYTADTLENVSIPSTQTGATSGNPRSRHFPHQIRPETMSARSCSIEWTFARAWRCYKRSIPNRLGTVFKLLKERLDVGLSSFHHQFTSS